MDTDTLNAEVKARIQKDQKQKLIEIARARHLKVADIVREALREKIALSKLAAQKRQTV